MSDDSSVAAILEQVAVEVSAVAAALVRNEAGHGSVARTKSSPTDAVTYTDLASEQLIRAELLARCPGSTIVGEEYDVEVGANEIGWIVDPIDGTVNFLYDLPVVSVSIAATMNQRIVAGAVADVHRGEVFSAALGLGARRDGRAIATSGELALSQSLIGTGFSYDAQLRASQAAVVARLLPKCRDIRCMGSAALNLCWIGCGRTDGYYERRLQPYDHAAGGLIAAEAGAVVQLPDATSDLTRASTPGVWDELVAVTND